MNKEATNYAEQTSTAFKDSLQYLIEQQTNQQMYTEQSQEADYQNLLAQINRQIDPVEQTYSKDAQSAYINKMLAQKQIEANLSRDRLSTQGFGTSELLRNEAAYSSNLTDLQTERASELQDINDQLTTAGLDYASTKASTQADFANQKLNLMQTIEQQTQDRYDTAYDRYVSNQQYKDALAQQALENKRAASSRSSSRSSGGSLRGTTWEDSSNASNLFVKTDYFNGYMPSDTYSDLQLGSFSTTSKNGVKYQPSYIKGNKIQGSMGTVAKVTGQKGTRNSSGVNVDNQKVWKLSDGSTWIWNGSKMKYERVVFT